MSSYRLVRYNNAAEATKGRVHYSLLHRRDLSDFICANSVLAPKDFARFSNVIDNQNLTEHTARNLLLDAIVDLFSTDSLVQKLLLRSDILFSWANLLYSNAEIKPYIRLSFKSRQSNATTAMLFLDKRK